MGEVFAFSALLLFSLNIIITKLASTKINLNIGFFIALITNVLFASILFGISFLFREHAFAWDGKALLLFAISGFFATYFGRWCFFKSIYLLGAAKASAFQSSNPLFTLILSWVFLKEKLVTLDIIAIFVTVLGLFLVAYGQKNSEDEWQRHNNENAYNWRYLGSSGICFALISAFSYSVGDVIRGAAVRDWNEPIAGALIGALVGLIIHLSLNLNLLRVRKIIQESNRQGILFFAVSGVLTIGAQMCLITSLMFLKVPIAILITLSTPILVIPISYFILKNDEGIQRYTIIGAGSILMGIILIVLN